MAGRNHYVEGLGEVKILRRRGMRNVRLRIDANGEICLSMPMWGNLRQALKFLENKKEWVKREKHKLTPKFADGVVICNDICLKLKPTDAARLTYKHKEATLTVHVPKVLKEEQKIKKLHKVVSGIIKKRALPVLAERTRLLSELHQLDYSSIKVAVLRSRWGSCSQNKDIKLNAYLIQLPDHLIDYVILHELNHTKHLNHGRKFWEEMHRIFPDTQQARTELRQYQPRVYTAQP